MSGYRHIIYVIVSILLLNASNLFAKVYWLPDYLGDNTNRSNGLEDNPQNGVVDKERGCPNGWLDAAQKGDMICDLMGNYPWVGYCYSNCKCKLDKYPYTSDNCTGTMAPSGDECNDGTVHYKECIDACETVEGVTNCPYGCKTTYAAEGCSTECKECYTDNCHNRTSVGSCSYGCENYFSDCSSKCQKCYADNCRNRTDNATDLGCDSYWQDCASKCEVGKTCVPTDCSAYTLTSCPANATCATCTVGCGNTTKKYKISKCNTGYTLSGSSCVANACAGYYECGGSWQYCTGSKCPTDSTKCSKYCVDDYFPNQCSSSSYCNGVYRSGYCSGSCDEPDESCDTSTYPYTSSNCSGTLGGTTCSDSSGTHYKTCTTTSTCTSSSYPYTSSNCSGSLGGGSCKTSSGTTRYKTCTIAAVDPCDSYTNKSCSYGCKTYYSDCSSKCKTCYSDNCHNRTDNSTALGCTTYWSDCSSKCKVGKDCTPIDCSAYTLSSCPSNGTCTNCTAGCGDSTKKYKLSSCNSGYELNAAGTACVNPCSALTAKSCSVCKTYNSTCKVCTACCDTSIYKYTITYAAANDCTLSGSYCKDAKTTIKYYTECSGSSYSDVY